MPLITFLNIPPLNLQILFTFVTTVLVAGRRREDVKIKEVDFSLGQEKNT